MQGGVTERNVARGVGLGVVSAAWLGQTAPELYVSDTALGVLGWSTLTLNRQHNGYGQTLALRVTQGGLPEVFPITVRVEGIDPTGVSGYELSPILAIPAATTTYVHMSRIWSFITKIQVLGSDAPVGSEISVGLRCDFELATVPGTTEHIGGENLGWSVPLLLEDFNGRLTDQCLCFSMYDPVNNQQLVVPDASIQLGRVVAEWAGTPDKIGIRNWAAVKQLSGADPDFEPPDQMRITATLRSQMA
jgi:hypothetical protein